MLNFKPKFNNTKLNLTGITNKLYCKNLLIFIIFLEFFLKNNNNYFLNVKLSTLKKKSKLNSFLRAPNKHKKAQVALSIERYYLYLKFTFFCNIQSNMLYKLPLFFYTLLNSINFFESTLMSMKTKKLTYVVPFCKMFKEL